MSSAKSNQAPAKPTFSRERQSYATVMTLAAIASTMLFLPGCSYLRPGQHIEVGSIPDDYRTTHPMNISEQDQNLDVPVGTSDKEISLAQRSVIEGFVAGYKNSGSGPVQLLLPSSGINAEAARRVAPQIAAALKKGGVTSGSIVTATYQSPSDAASPVRITYRMVTASTDQCGKWPEDISESAENKHYKDYGCSYQNNFAAQLANPADLLGPRGTSDIDATKRQKVISDYQKASPSTSSEVDY